MLIMIRILMTLEEWIGMWINMSEEFEAIWNTLREVNAGVEF